MRNVPLSRGWTGVILPAGQQAPVAADIIAGQPGLEPATRRMGAGLGLELPLILITVVVHVCGLGLIYERAIRLLGRRCRGAADDAAVPGAAGRRGAAGNRSARHRGGRLGGRPMSSSVPCQDGASRCCIHLAPSPAYGHANEYLRPAWQLLGALEALNGMMLFGLTSRSCSPSSRDLAAQRQPGDGGCGRGLSGAVLPGIPAGSPW